MLGTAQLIGGAVGAIGSLSQMKRLAREQREAQGIYDQSMDEFTQLDTSNPFTNMENTMEDLTVNTQAARFQQQQQAQGFADTMQAMRGASGGSGIAALAQSLANAQATAAQASSASIGRQEAGNQLAAAQQAGQLQSMERQGDVMSRNWERHQTETELGMAQHRLAAANMAKQQNIQNLVGGVGGMVMGGMSLTPQAMEDGLDSFTMDKLDAIFGWTKKK